MTVPDPTAPTATDVLADVIHTAVREGWVYDSPVERSLAMWDPRPTTAAVVAAVRGMDAETLAELRPDLIVERVDGLPSMGGAVSAVRVVGPWQETQP